jgi:hypothetical protein
MDDARGAAVVAGGQRSTFPYLEGPGAHAI